MSLRLQLRQWIGTASTLALALCVAVAPVSATVLKLSSQTNQHGNVHGWQVSLNGQYAVYGADRLGDGSDEIYSVPIAGGTPVRLNVTPEPGRQVGLYAISPDSQWVVYIVPQQSGQGLATPAELFRVPIGGGPSVKLSGPLAAGGFVWSFIISPNSARVIYRAYQGANDVYELYSVPLDASAPPVKLNPTPTTNGDVSTFYRVTSDSSRVVYVADQDTNDVDELYSVPVTGGSAIKLNTPLVMDGDVGFQAGGEFFTLSPDGARVVYYADQETDGRMELFSASVSTAASSVKLNVELTSGHVSPGAVRLSPDGSRVLYATSVVSFTLYSVPVSGPASASVVLISGNFPSVFGSFSADGNTVVGYRPDGSMGSMLGATLISVPATGPASSAITLATGVQTLQYSGGSRVAYSVPTNGGSSIDVYGVPVIGPSTAAVRLNAPAVEGDQGYRLSPDETRLVYESSDLGGNPRELFSVPITGPYTDSIKISGPLVSGGDVEYYFGFAFTPDGQRVVYRADAETDGKIELYVTDEGNLVSNKVYLPLVLR
ncbi:MAG: hypothetical protein ACT4QE_02960 [Anaerolineales bacterium]